MNRSLDPRFLRQIADTSIRFVHFETLSSLIPVVIVTLVAAFIDQVFLIVFPGPIRAAWWLFVQSLLVGRFTLGAAEGRFNADVFDHFNYARLIPYMAKYLTLSAIWAVPIFGLLFILSPIDQIRISGLLEWLIAHVYLTGSEPFRPNFAFWLILLGITAGTLLPLLTAVLAALARTPIHAVFPSLWKHPFRTGAPALVVLVSFLGAITAVFILFLPFIGGASVIAYQLSPTLGSILGGFAILLPVMSWPIIAGRLAGTFVYFHPLTADADLQLTDPDEVHMPPVIQKGTQSISLSSSPAESLFDAPDMELAPFGEPAASAPEQPTEAQIAAQQRAERAAAAELDDRIAAARILLESESIPAARAIVAIKKEHPDDPRVLGLEVLALAKIGHRPKALALAIPAVQALVQSPYSSEIPTLYHMLGKDRHTLPWDSTLLNLLVKVFLDAKDFKESGWCSHTCELQMGHVERAGKRLVQVADAATAARDFEAAVALYKYYLKNHPDGPFADYAKKAVEFNQKQSQ